MNQIWEDWLVEDITEEPKVYNTWILRISVKLVTFWMRGCLEGFWNLSYRLCYTCFRISLIPL